VRYQDENEENCPQEILNRAFTRNKGHRFIRIGGGRSNSSPQGQLSRFPGRRTPPNLRPCLRWNRYRDAQPFGDRAPKSGSSSDRLPRAGLSDERRGYSMARTKSEDPDSDPPPNGSPSAISKPLSAPKIPTPRLTGAHSPDRQITWGVTCETKDHTSPSRPPRTPMLGCTKLHAYRPVTNRRSWPKAITTGALTKERAGSSISRLE